MERNSATMNSKVNSRDDRGLWKRKEHIKNQRSGLQRKLGGEAQQQSVSVIISVSFRRPKLFTRLVPITVTVNYSQ